MISTPRCPEEPAAGSVSRQRTVPPGVAGLLALWALVAGVAAPQTAPVTSNADSGLRRTVRTAAIKVDGQLTEPEWERTTALRTFSFPWSQRDAPATEFRAVADAEQLYFAFFPVPSAFADWRVPGPASALAVAFRTRGVVLVPEDLSLVDWPERAAQAGLTTIALHHGTSPKAIADFIESAAGREFLAKCARLKLEVEYELHAMRELLPRAIFATQPALFRMNEQGQRTPDANLCVHSTQALHIVATNALRLARQLRPTTSRYFLWGDDGQPWCRCPQCREFSDSDQALLLENHLVRELRRIDPAALLAHLAYANTLPAPTSVKPAPGVFLEFAPIHRRYDLPYAQQTGPEAKDALPALEQNLRLFPAATAQVLEYWLDVSRFSQWKRPAVRLPWRRDVLAADAATYAQFGLQHVTTFAVWIDADYVERFGEPVAIREYGETLRSFP